MGIGAGRSKGA